MNPTWGNPDCLDWSWPQDRTDSHITGDDLFEMPLDLNEHIYDGNLQDIKRILQSGDFSFDGNTNYSLYQLMTDYLGSIRNNTVDNTVKIVKLLISYGLDIKVSWTFLSGINETLGNKIWKTFLKDACFEACIGLKSLEISAGEMMEILKNLHPYSLVVPDYYFWKCITLIKHPHFNHSLHYCR